MNNLRLLTGTLVAALLSGGMCAYGQQPDVVTLDELFRIAETNSALLRPSFTAEEESRLQTEVAKSARLPEIGANIQFSFIGDGFTTDRHFGDSQKAPIPHFGNGIGVSVSQPVYAGGAINSGIALARLKEQATRHTTEKNRDDLRMSLTEFYLDLYKQENLKKVVDDNIAHARKLLEQMKARHEEGTALQNDITRYELLVADLKLQHIKISNTIAILNSNIRIIAGLPEGTIVHPDTTMLRRSLPSDSEGWWQQSAQENSPQLSLARTGIAISKEAEHLARSERLPKIGLQAAWTIDGPILTEIPPIDRNLSYWYVGVGISYNISSLYKSNKTLAKSQAATRMARENLEAAQKQLEMGVRADYIRYLEAYEELKTQEKSVELAESNYQTVTTRYSADMALITDLLDAANSRLDAQQRLVNARINIIYSYYKLLYTAGKI